MDERERLQQAILRAYRVPPRLIGLNLPRRTRIRLWVTRQIDGAASWLINHHPGAAIRLWRIFRLW